MAFALTPERDKRVDELLSQYPTKRAALLPILWLCQEQNGWISPDVIDMVASRLAISTAAVKGVVTFYTMFFDKPVGENVVWVCRTIGCEIRGGKTIQEHLEKRLSCHAGETTKDGKFTLLRAECLAACGQAPMMQINDEYFENLDVKAVDKIIDSIVAGELKPARVSVMPPVAASPLAPSTTRTSIPSPTTSSATMASATTSASASTEKKLPSIPPPSSGTTKLPSIPPQRSPSVAPPPASKPAPRPASVPPAAAKPASVPPAAAKPAASAPAADAAAAPDKPAASADKTEKPDSNDKAEVS